MSIGLKLKEVWHFKMLIMQYLENFSSPILKLFATADSATMISG